MNQAAPATKDDPARARRMAVLANCDPAGLARLWQVLGIDPAFEILRGPETGLVALRGRVGGGGAPFNFGEATATRVSVRLEGGAVGHAMQLGRDHARAKIAAVIDALCASDPQTAERIEAAVIDPLAREAQDRDSRRAAETAATRVDFFTMVRGED